MHYKFIVISRFICCFGILSLIALAVISFFDLAIVLPAPIAYAMLIATMLMALCLLIAFAMDIMSHLIRHDMSAIIWLFVFAVVITMIQIAVHLYLKQSVDYINMFYNGFVASAAIRGLWYIIGIRAYEIKKLNK